jgi:hypothetical protein
MTTDAFDIDAPAAPKTTEPPWTIFWDMHSGGGTKVDPFEKIYIQAPEAEAKVIFYKRFGRNPERVTCTCCGEDYSISEYPTLQEASGYHRNLRYVTRKPTKGQTRSTPRDHRYLEPGEAMPEGFDMELSRFVADKKRPEGLTLREHIQQPDVKIIPASEILPAERVGSVPREGYVWAGDDE